MMQLLAESFLLALVGGGVGLYIAWDGIRAALSVFPTEVLRFKSIGIKSYPLVFALAVPLPGIFLFGLPRILIIRRLLSRTSHTKKHPHINPFTQSGKTHSSAPRSSSYC